VRNAAARRWLGGVALLALAFALLHAAHAASRSIPNPQTRINIRFVEEPRLLEALAGYTRWPPAYPTLLWAARRVGLEPVVVNELLFCASLALLWRAARALVPGVHPALPTLAYASAHFNVSYSALAVSEALFVPLVLAFLLLFWRQIQRDSSAGLLALAGSAAALCLTRYFAIFWLVPLGGVNLLALPGSARRRAARAGVFAALALLPVGAWMIKELAQSGHAFGMDRFSPRRNQAEVDLPHNLLNTAKSFHYDLLSPLREASHVALRAPWPPSSLELAIAVGVAAALLGALWTLYRGRPHAALDGKRLAGLLHTREGVVAQLFFGYVAVLIAVWTAGNNDPIFGRFLYPSYVLLLLLLCQLYARVRTRRAVALPLRAAFVAFIAIQLWRTWQRLGGSA
jgi:hypothetical protein